MESITYEMERRTSERLTNLRTELGMQELENRIASTNLLLKKMNNEMTPVTDKGVTVSHLLLLENVAKRVANLETGNRHDKDISTDRTPNHKLERFLEEMTNSWIEEFKCILSPD